jgi:alkylhydroperoxidase family enzyme
VLDDWRSAPIAEPLRVMLGFLEKLTLEPAAVTAGDVVPLRARGLSDAAIEDAIHVAVLFNVYDRMADTLGFDVPGPESFAHGAKVLLTRGYK